MGKGGGASVPEETTQRQTNIPKFAEPYFMAMMDDATAISSQAYTPYGDQRLAGQTGDTLQSYDMVRNLAGAGIPYMDQAVSGTQGAMDAAQGIAEYNPYQFSNTASGFNYGNPQMWESSVAQQYMSPYMENVMDVQKDRALLDFNRMQQYRDAEATKAGAFGGSRQGVVDALAQEDLARRMGEIDAMGLQSAYQDAGNMFQSDRSFGFGVNQAQAGENARVQDALWRLQGAQAGENYNAAGMGLQGIGMYGDLASRLAGFGDAERAADIQGAQLLESQGQAQQAYDQAGLDIGYQDFLNQRDWDADMLSWYSDILRGVPVSNTDVTSQSYVQTNPLKDALGLGISAIGLYNGLSA